MLVQRQQWIPSAVTLSKLIRRSDSPPPPKILANFAGAIDHMHRLGLIHWDLKPSNICWDGETLHLLDWEPSLLQYQSGKLTLVVTPAYVAPSERRGPGPMALSDRFAWIKTLLLLGLRNETFDDVDDSLTQRSRTSSIDRRIEDYVRNRTLALCTWRDFG